jgi:hypothetical protein
MIKALAPRMPRGCSWVWLSIVVALAGAPLQPVGAQTTKPTAPADAEAASKKDEESTKKADAEAPAEKPNATAEVFKDSRAEKAMPNTFPALYKPCSIRDTSAVRAMAAGQSSVDRDTIVRFVEGMAYELTNKTNIRALIDPAANVAPGSRTTHAIQEATDNLIDAIQTAKLSNNASFLSTYNKVLFEKLPALLYGHLLSRIEAMIVLAQTGDASPEMVGLFVKQLNDAKQTVWVKLWAARGLTNTAPTLSNDARRAMAAAKAVADFLDQEKDLPWPVQYRALEALGALRQASTARPPKGQPEMASAAIKFLVDPQARPEVRAEAAWALGMMQVSGAIGKYNFPLIAYDIGDVAAMLGESINDAFANNPSRSEYLAGLLINQLYQALEGVPNARDSGLLHGTHPNLAPSRNYIKQVSELVKSVAKSSIELFRAPKGQVPRYQKELGDRVAALKGFLDKNQPANSWLVPGGPEFPPPKPVNAVAGAPGEAPVAGVPGQ